VLVLESRHVRRFAVRIDRGEEVIGSLKKLAESERFRAASIRGTGHLEWAELVHWDPEREAETRPRRVAGPLLALAVEGNVSMRMGEPYVELRGCFSREGDVGVTVVGGQVALASALALELFVEVLEDVRLERDEDPPTGLSLWKGERTPGAVARASASAAAPKTAPKAAPPSPQKLLSSPPAPTPITRERPAREEEEDEAPAKPVETATLGWAQVAAVSEEAERAQPAAKRSARDEGDEPTPVKGDWVEHRQFGLCRVDGEDAEGALIIRLPNTMRKHDGDRRIFPLRPRVRR
jgi:predicted DNA-binding protein with PD1-like motif